MVTIVRLQGNSNFHHCNVHICSISKSFRRAPSFTGKQKSRLPYGSLKLVIDLQSKHGQNCKCLLLQLCFFLAFSFSALCMCSETSCPFEHKLTQSSPGGRTEWKNGKLGEGNIFSCVI